MDNSAATAEEPNSLRKFVGSIAIVLPNKSDENSLVPIRVFHKQGLSHDLHAYIEKDANTVFAGQAVRITGLHGNSCVTAEKIIFS
jgi:hypothetical protein